MGYSVRKRTGSQYYWIDVVYKGHRIRQSSEFKNAKEAMKIAQRVYEDLVKKGKGIRNDITLKEATKSFLRFSKSFKTSFQHDKSRAKKIIQFFTPSIFLKEIKKKHVEAFVDFLKSDISPRQGGGVSDSSIKRYLNLLSVIFNTAAENGDYDGSNPVKTVISQIEDSQPAEHYFTIDELKLIFDVARNISRTGETQSDRDFYVYLVLIAIGVRPIEIFQIMKSHIQPERILIPKRTKSKTRQNRFIFLSPATYKILNGHQSEGLFLISTLQRNSNAFRNQWTRVQKTTSLTGRMYDIRHTFATVSYETERDILLVKDLMGHTRMETTRRYIGREKTRIEEASQRIQNKLLGPGQGKNIIPLGKKKSG